MKVWMDLYKVQKQGRDEKNYTRLPYYVTMVTSSLASNAMHLHPFTCTNKQKKSKKMNKLKYLCLVFSILLKVSGTIAHKN